MSLKSHNLMAQAATRPVLTRSLGAGCVRQANGEIVPNLFATDWVEENVALEPYQWMGGAFFGDTRVMHGLLDIITEAGFTLNTGD